MLRHYSLISSFFFLFTASVTEAQTYERCPALQLTDTGQGSLLSRFGSGDPDVIEFQVGEVVAQLGDLPITQMSGGVLLRRGNRLAGADLASYDPVQQKLSLSGNVRYEDTNAAIIGNAAEFEYATNRIRFGGAEFLLGRSGARGTASSFEINEDGDLLLTEVGYSTCAVGSEAWIILADDITLDVEEGVGVAHDVKLSFKGLPILYTPYLSFPITEARKSGILTPEVGGTSRGGNELSLPYYWNISSNYDATLTPRYLTERGLQMGVEGRYLLQNGSGKAFIEYLPHDNKLDDERYLLSFEHSTIFKNGWRTNIDFRQVSDAQYFEDLGGSLSASSITHLNRSATLDYYSDHWSIMALFQDYQTIDQAIMPIDQPYQRLPQVLVSGFWPNSALGLDYSLDSELVNFYRDIGTTGWRFNLAPGIKLPIEKPGWFITPGLKVDYTQYDLKNRLPGTDTEPHRALPIASLDMGLNFERLTAKNTRIQTIEPRILYVHVPFRDQDHLPIFDTIFPDLNLVQLYRENRFLGIDRINNTDQISMGVTTRIVDTSSGRELMSATIGQARYLSDQRVHLPDEPVTPRDSSDYIAELRFLIYDNLNFDIGHQWSDSGGTTRSEARFQYRPASNKIINLAYRFRRGSLEHGDITWVWPILTNWNFVGRYNFSLRDNKVLEQFYGLEYESCCWAMRLVGRKYISTRDGTRDSSIGLQLILKGMSSIGTGADQLLERGILGYGRNLN